MSDTHAANGAAGAALGSMLLLFVLALLPRVLNLATFLTVDEVYHWFERAATFRAALQQGEFAATNLIGHPGVTTMWLGAAGLSAWETFAGWGWLPPLSDAAPARMWWAVRLPVGICTALCVALSYPLLRRLFSSRRVALLAGLLLAFDPFLVAHSRLLHVDALLASCVLLALLAGLLAFRLEAAPDPAHTGPRWPWLIASAVAGGLAFLTKSPSVLLLPCIGGIALVGGASLTGTWSPWRVLRRIWLPLLVWGGVALLVWLAGWPAAWVNPVGAATRMVNQVRFEGGTPHGWGNFFLGQPTDNPGPLFYPVVLALRLPPWTLAGVALLLAGLALRDARLPNRRALLLLGGCGLLFGAVLSLPPKKFDRYILPVFPLLSILAAVGLVWLWDISKRTLPRLQRSERLALGLVGLLLAGNLAWYHPYAMAYYSPLFGGGAVAARTIPVGWGEGLEQAGAYIDAQVNGCDYPVATWFDQLIDPFVCAHVVRLREVSQPGRVDYAVLYIDQVQRNNEPEATRLLRTEGTRVHAVEIHGVPYAEVYQLPRPVSHTVQASFDNIALQGYTLATDGLRSSGVITLTTQWQAFNSPGRDYMLFVYLFDAAGNRIAQIDVPPAGPHNPTSGWNRGQYAIWYHPIPVPADLPPGTYRLALGLYHPETFARVPLAGPPERPPPPPDAPDAGPDVLWLEFQQNEE